MRKLKTGLANLEHPGSGEESVVVAEKAIARAGAEGAEIVCFPECFVPGYRGLGHVIAPVDEAFLERAWTRVGAAAKKARVAVILGTERVIAGNLLASALVFGRDGTRMGFQDKVQIDPSEEGTYAAGQGRRVFREKFSCGDVTFGVTICHEGWRYPETVRFAAAAGAEIVFHPHYHPAEPGGFRPTEFADPRNSFHEKAALCRAAENTCYFAMVNFASDGSATTSAVIRPDGTVQCWQPYGKAGLLTAEIDLDAATRLLARRFRPDGF